MHWVYNKPLLQIQQAWFRAIHGSKQKHVVASGCLQGMCLSGSLNAATGNDNTEKQVPKVTWMKSSLGP